MHKNLLENAKWVKGLGALSSLGMHFDAQLNPHQYARAIEVFNALPDLKGGWMRRQHRAVL